MEVEARLLPGERDALLDEMQDELPLWLERGANAGPPADELTDLLRFRFNDLRRAHAVHLCVDDVVQDFVAALPSALRTPIPSTQRPIEIASAIRGPIDWPQTIQLHASGQRATYATRPRRRTFDTPEHRALQWAVHQLMTLVSLSRLDGDGSEDSHADGSRETGTPTVGEMIQAVDRAAHVSKRTEWLRGIRSERPGAAVRQRLADSRSGFARHRLAPLVERLLVDELGSSERLAQMLRDRYFEPAKDWRLYEVVVLIRLDRALCAASDDHRRRRLLHEGGVSAEYRLADGSTIVLRQQGWPDGTSKASRRQEAAARHGLRVTSTIPDLIVERTGPNADRLILELKASRVPATLGAGLSQLLGYLHERPTLFGRQPAGWLVPLPGSYLSSAAVDATSPLWIVAADAVAPAVLDRLGLVRKPPAALQRCVHDRRYRSEPEPFGLVRQPY